MATYIYRCDCMEGEVEVTQPMSEDTFTSCLQVYERLGQPAPDGCSSQGGCRAERLIAQTAGVISSGPKSACSIGEKAAGCGSCCSPPTGGAGHCPFG